jgi:hypothetical protein
LVLNSNLSKACQEDRSEHQDNIAAPNNEERTPRADVIKSHAANVGE